MQTPDEKHAVLRALRTRGFQDALAGRRKMKKDPVYLAAYLRGVKRRKLLRSGGMEKEEET